MTETGGYRCGHRIPATCRTSGRRASGAQRLEAAGNLQLESEPTTGAHFALSITLLCVDTPGL
eukprot:359621-Rhodomonas_salina.4